MKCMQSLFFIAFLFLSIQIIACSGSGNDDPNTDGDDELTESDAEQEDQTDGDDENEESEDSEQDEDCDTLIDGDGEVNESDGDTIEREPLFINGCPEEGYATATEIIDSEQKMYGPDAIGEEGDFLLMNTNAAFIIEGIENLNAYYLYSGIPVDAVAIEDCAQASPERFEEVGFLFGQLNITSFESSILRAFRGESIEIVNDGADGEAAVVRVHGTDDYFWVVEYTLIREALSKGTDKGLSEPLGVDIFIDYILEPDSNVLQIEINLKNQDSEEKIFLYGSEIMFGDTTKMRYYADDVWDIGGFSLDRGIPWVVASKGDGAWAYALKDAVLSATEISGVNALVDFNQALISPITLKPLGDEGDSATYTSFLTVGGTDSNSATKHLQLVNNEPLPDFDYTLVTLNGVVKESSDESPIAGVQVDLEKKNGNENWMVLDTFYTDEDGLFAGEIPKFESITAELRLMAHLEGRPDSDPYDFEAGDTDLELSLTPAGQLHYQVTNGSDEMIPAKILLWQDGKVKKYIFSTRGNDIIDVVPGQYGASVTRGFEYTTHYSEITITAGETTTLYPMLTHALDTTGFLSMDGHVHAGPSPDNWISIPERIATVGSEGLEVVVSTDHEYIADWAPGVDETGLGDWVVTVIGQEVTATVPEHTNMYPVTPNFEENARGGYIRWYEMDYKELFAAIRDFGAGVVGINHPSGYLDLVEFDPFTATPLFDDPTKMGLHEDAELWDWNFDTIELMNGNKKIFSTNGDDALFDYWMSFLNHGQKKTVVGVSDAHNYTMPGYPRTYFKSSSDEVTGFDEAELINAMHEGRALISTGAFATVDINGTAKMGDTITDSDGTTELNLKITAIEEVDVSYFKVYVNCDQVATIPTTDPDALVKFDGMVQLTLNSDAHVVVLGFGENDLPVGFKTVKSPDLTPRFVTNAIYVDFDGNGEFDHPGDKTCTYDTNPPVAD